MLQLKVCVSIWEQRHVVLTKKLIPNLGFSHIIGSALFARGLFERKHSWDIFLHIVTCMEFRFTTLFEDYIAHTSLKEEQWMYSLFMCSCFNLKSRMSVIPSVLKLDHGCEMAGPSAWRTRSLIAPPPSVLAPEPSNETIGSNFSIWQHWTGSTNPARRRQDPSKRAMRCNNLNEKGQYSTTTVPWRQTQKRVCCMVGDFLKQLLDCHYQSSLLITVYCLDTA